MAHDVDPAPGGAATAPFVPIGTSLKNQAGRLRMVEDSRKFQPIVYWYISFRCNLACAHCSVHSSPWVDTSNDLRTEECYEVIDQMTELNVGAAMLTGGEFLVRRDAMDLLRAFDSRGIGVALESNGLSFPPGFLELAGAMQKKGKFSISISLDGGTPESHEVLRGPRSFERTLRNLRRLHDARIRYVVQCVLNGSNYQTISDLYRLAEGLTPYWHTVQWAILNPIGRGVGLVKQLGLKPEHISAIFESIERSKHGYPGKTVIAMPPAMVPPQYLHLAFKERDVRMTTTCQFPLLGVLPNGDVTICALSRDNEDLHFGNIRDRSRRLRDIWEEARLSSLRSRYVGAEDLQGICGDCVWKYACKGACRAWAYEEGGDFDAPFPICKALDEAGAFPKAYRLSEQNAAAERFRQMQVGCGCSHAPA